MTGITDEFDHVLDTFLLDADALLPPAAPEVSHGFTYIRAGGWSFDADEETLDGAREAIRAFAALAVYLQKSAR